MKKKTIALLLVMMMVFGITVGGTIAYLTDKTEAVTNTFTVGKVGISLDEAQVDEYGSFIKAQKDADGNVVVDTDGNTVYEAADVNTADRVAGNVYKLIPGRTYNKVPFVTVDSDSEEAWLFVRIDNGLSEIEADTKIADQMTAGDDAKWELVAGQTNVYAYKTKVKANDEIAVFSTFTLTDDANVEAYSTAKITITAYAVQADGMSTAAYAWQQAPTSWN